MAYTAPCYPDKELVSASSVLNIKINDIRNPDARKWRGYFSSMFEVLTERNMDETVQMVISRTDPAKFDHPEIYDEANSILIFTKCLERVMEACGVESFGVQSVIEPAPSKLRSILSCFINASLFWKTRRDHVESRKEEFEKKMEEHEDVIQRHKMVKEKLALLKENKTEQKYKEVSSNLSALENRLSERLNMEKQVKKEASNIKLKSAEIEAQLTRIQEEKAYIQAEIDILQPKIVSSPTRVAQEQDAFKNDLITLKKNFDDKQRQLKENRKLYDCLLKNTTTSEKVLKLEKKVQSVSDDERNIHKEIKQKIEELQERNEQAKQLLLQESDIENFIKLRQEQNRNKKSKLSVQSQVVLDREKELKEQREEYNTVVTRLKENSNADIQKKFQMQQKIDDQLIALKLVQSSSEDKSFQAFKSIDTLEEKFSVELTRNGL